MQLFKMRVLSVAVSSLLLSFSQQALSVETLRSAVAATVNTNPDVRISAKVRSASNEEVSQARAGYFPTFDVNAGFGRERATNVNNDFGSVNLWRTDFGFNARQMIVDGLATYSDVARTKAKTNADAYKVWGTAEDTALSAVQSYLDILRNQELVVIAEKNLDANAHTFRIVSRLSEQGLGRAADTDQTSGRVDLARANLISARNNLQDARVTFQKVTGIIPGRLEPAPDVKNSALPKSQPEALQLALMNHPILKSATADISEARAQHVAAKSKLYPRLDLVASGFHDKNQGGVTGPDDDLLVMLDARWNILQGGKDVARIRETAFETQRATEIRNKTERQVIESMELSWVAYQNAMARMPSLVAHKSASAQTTHAYYKQFELAKRTILDVLDSQNEFYTAEQDLINERYALLFAKYRILNSMGQLVEYLGVPLPPEACIPYNPKGLY